jgi:hypothetical protein
VVLNGKYSTWAEVLSGVPQGSVLGPILFLIFINDLDCSATSVDILRKFADDTKLGQRAETQEERGRMQHALNNLCEWSQKWGMEFNIKKCKVMHLGHNNPCQQYSMDGQILEETNEERDIGVEMAKNLKPSAQCAKAARTGQTVLSQITRAFHYRDKNIYMRLYAQYVRPHLEFASPAWSPWTEMDKAVLEKIQRRAVSMVSGLKGNTYEDKLRELGMLTLEERRHQADMAQTFKIIRGVDKVNSDSWFQMVDQAGRATRSTDDPLNVRPKATRLEIRKKIFSSRVTESWNKIPSYVKNVKTVSGFKRSYKKHRELVAPP